ncbi:MAG: GNAT family N-acetyltransferase [Planctomycetota bacterium]
MTGVEIRTERLILRQPRIDDAEPLMAVFGDAEAMRFVNHGKTRSIDEVCASIQKRIECFATHGFTLWTVVVAETSDIIGDCGVIPIDWTEPEFELGYRFRPSAWGNGYATEAGMVAMEHAWRVSTLDTIYAVTDLENHASQRVLTKIGFADERVTDKYYDASLRFFRFDRPGGSLANDPA